MPAHERRSRGKQHAQGTLPPRARPHEVDRLDAQQSLAEAEGGSMLRNVVRGILNLVLAAAATWMANYITDRIFGPEEDIQD